MKRDMELVRKLMQKLEEQSASSMIERDEIKIDGYGDETVAAHLNLLIDEGLIADRTARALQIKMSRPSSTRTDGMWGLQAKHGVWLTWSGYDFLESLRQ